MKNKINCLNCKKEIKIISESQIGRQIYAYEIETKNWDIPSYGDFEGDHEKWLCSECGAELSEEIVKKVAPELF